MKRRFSKILGVGLTLALLTSLLLTAAPVMAKVSQPTVDLSADEISEEDVIYTISFRINTELVEDEDPTITVRFPDDTDVAAVDTGDVTIEVTSGIGSDSGAVAGLTVTIDPDDPIVEIELDDLSNMQTAGPYKIGAMAYVQVEIADVTNPTDPGTYTLEVMTSAEDSYVKSESYDIGVPALPGGIYVKNASGILVGFETNLNDAVVSVTAADFTITVGPGTYEITGTLLLDREGLTLKSSAGAEDTIIDGSLISPSDPVIAIHGNDVTVEGFTVDDGPGDAIWIRYNSEGITVQNNIIRNIPSNFGAIILTYEAGAPTEVVVGATVSGNIIEDGDSGIYLQGCAKDNTISGNTITGIRVAAIVFGSGTSGNSTQGNTITGNTLTDNDGIGIWLTNGLAASDYEFDDNVIEENTISGNEGDGILIDASLEITELQILDNYIADNEGDGIEITSWDDTSDDVSNVIKFNTITGNGDDGINNKDSAVNVDATFNWWGTTDADDIADMVSAEVTYEPFLTDTAEAAIAGGKAAANASSLDAKTECGVKVSGVLDTTNEDLMADVICALKYKANPEEAIDDAIAFYDVYVALPTAFDTAEVTAKLKFYDSAITTGSVANFWTGDFWAECSDLEARDGIIYVTISDDTLPALDELEETIFAVVAGEAVEEELYECPQCGLRFATEAALEVHWKVVHAPPPVVPEPEPPVWTCAQCGLTFDTRDGLVAHITTAHPPVEPVEPVEPVAPVPLPDIILEPPDIIVEPPDIILPAETPITPSWIYVIIGVGAVLVIALIVLIVRTRRVA